MPDVPAFAVLKTFGGFLSFFDSTKIAIILGVKIRFVLYLLYDNLSSVLSEKVAQKFGNLTKNA